MITYRQFRNLVNHEVLRQSGMGLDCLADCDLCDYFDRDMTETDAREAAIEAAYDVLAQNDFPMDCIGE